MKRGRAGMATQRPKKSIGFPSFGLDPLQKPVTSKNSMEQQVTPSFCLGRSVGQRFILPGRWP